MAQTTKWRLNERPRFSALQLGEYIAADDSRRETILRGMKFERMGQSLSYKDGYLAVGRFLSSPTRDPRILLDYKSYLEDERETAANPTRKNNFASQINAIEVFERQLNALGIGGLTFRLAPMTRSYLVYEGVRINVQPLVEVIQRRPRGADLAGALILDLAIGQTSNKPSILQRQTDAMNYTAILLCEHVAQKCAGGELKPSPEHCIVFHAHRGERVTGRSNYRSDLKIVHAACRGVMRDWDHIEPPPSFDMSECTVRH